MFLKILSFLFLISSIFFSINFSSAKSPRENWNYGKTGKEIKHHTEHVNINPKGLKNKSKEGSISRPGSPRERY
ncbi:MAG: hypothetical protein CBC86_0003660 [Deltaproteobacteria bacterium TMED126]|jgi:hypothetical protein|nr:hypothetical protein [Candidatus Dadabacteria bacterium]NSW97689.1 hypothetical protein [Deltaproteobacteria bacterium TMED126]|tara:strand:+ start:11721 stop:11942 length:222 start_codon:yes stop_codon:yes gene_type:complete